MVGHKINKAVEVMLKAHKDEVRKIGGIPFSFHPMDTALILHRHGFPEDVIIAGLLHDVVEHNKMTVDDIEKMFGERVAVMVDDCTARNESDWKKGKQYYLSHIGRACTESKAIACADKISNLKDTHRYKQDIGEKIWDIFKTGKRGQEWYLKNLRSALCIPHPIYYEFCVWIEKVIS